MRLAGKVALITGAASGIGAAAVERFIQEGCRVALCDIQKAEGTALAEKYGDKAMFSYCNITDEESVSAAIDAATTHFGRLDVMFNSAGIVGSVGPVAQTPGAEWRFTIDVLLNGAFYCAKHAARVMQPQGSGSIISMASTAGLMGGLGPHAYTAAKHGVVGLTKNLAAELAGSNVRVNAIAAASMATGHALTTDAGFTIGATVAGPAFAEYQPLIREAGKSGLPE